MLDRADVDTDQIIPKQFLKRVERTGFGEFLFYDWIRDGEIELEPNPILVAGRNFGCGSSREHAPWALQDFGFEAIIAPVVRRHLLRQLHQDRPAAGDPRRGRMPGVAEAGAARIDLDDQTVTRPPAWSSSRSTRRSSTASLHGLDDIGVTLQNAGAIDAFEASGRRRPRPRDDSAVSGGRRRRDWDARDLPPGRGAAGGVGRGRCSPGSSCAATRPCSTPAAAAAASPG